MLSHSQRLFLRTSVCRIQATGVKKSLPLNYHHAPVTARPVGMIVRHWSAKVDTNEKKDDGENKESLQDTVRRMQGKEGSSEDPNIQLDGALRKAADVWSTFSEEVGKAWNELLKSGERKDINKKLIHPEDTTEGEAPYTGSVQIMVIDESEHLTAWERMQRRLTDAPIISGES